MKSQSTSSEDEEPDYRFAGKPSLRDVTPPPTFTSLAQKKSERPMPLMGELPRILIELWHGSADHEREDFLAETWIPSLHEFELKAETLRLSLKRSVRDKESARIVSARKWFGSLVASMRYRRPDNRLELFLVEAKELQLGSFSENEFFLKIFSFVVSDGHTAPLSLVYRTARRAPSQASKVEFNEFCTIKFGSSRDSQVKQLEVISATNKTVPLVAPATLVALMLRDPLHVSAVIAPEDAKYKNLTSLYDLLVFSGKDEFFKFSPKYNRFETYLLPTHEMTALSGAEFQLRSQTQLDALRSNEEYMRAHTQVVELLLISWGLGLGDEKKGSWNGHSWLFRHVLLSCILLKNADSIKRLVAVGKSLSLTRQIDPSEQGFGEALFTLENNEAEAKLFWEKNDKQRPVLRHPYLPPIRTSLGQLMHW